MMSIGLHCLLQLISNASHGLKGLVNGKIVCLVISLDEGFTGSVKLILYINCSMTNAGFIANLVLSFMFVSLNEEDLPLEKKTGKSGTMLTKIHNKTEQHLGWEKNYMFVYIIHYNVQ